MDLSELRFTVGGRELRVSHDQVIKKLKGEKPGPIQTHKVDVEGVDFAVKEALAKATGLDVLDFNTNQARGILKRLGFKVERVK